MRWISPRAVLFQPHKACDPVNPAISREMRQSATGVRFAGRTLNFPTAKRRISQRNLKCRRECLARPSQWKQKCAAQITIPSLLFAGFVFLLLTIFILISTTCLAVAIASLRRRYLSRSKVSR